MQHITRTWQGGVFIVLAVAATAAPLEPTSMELRLIDRGARTPMAFGRSFDSEGRITFPFANTAGKLTFERGPGDTVKVDRNGDGQLDAADEPPLPTVATGAVVRVAALLGGRKVEYALSVRVLQPRAVILGSACALEGRQGDLVIKLFDANINGRFADQEGDTLSVGAGQPVPGRLAPAQPFCAVLDWQGRLMQAALSEDAARLNLTPYTGVTAQVSIEVGGSFASGEVLLQHTGGVQTVSCKSGQTAAVVPGAYRLARCVLQPAVATNAGARQPRLPLYATQGAKPDRPPIALQAGQNVIKVGAPFTLGFAATLKDNEVSVKRVDLTGAAGEAYRVYVQAGQEESFGALVRAGTREAPLSKLEYG